MQATRFPSKRFPWRVQLPGRYSADGKRKTRYFETQEAAEKFASQVRKYGLPKPEAPKPEITERHQALLEHILSTLPGADPEAHLYKAVEYYRSNVLNVKAATLGEAIAAYLAFREKGGAKRRSMQTLRCGLVHKLAKHFNESVALIEITTVMMREFLDTIKKGGARRTVYKSVNAFLNWACKYGYLSANPLANIDIANEVGDFGVNNEYMPVKDFHRALRIAAGIEPVKPEGVITREFLNLLPVFVLGGFAGVRTCELCRRNSESEVIRWTDLHFDGERPNVHIRAEVAKLTKAADRDRYIDMPHAIEAIKAWLPYCPKNGPFIVAFGERQIWELRKEFTKATGIKLIENGLRNSFATYATAYDGESAIGAVSRQMGNDAKTARRYYQRNLPSGTGKAWFNLRPFEVVHQSKQEIA